MLRNVVYQDSTMERDPGFSKKMIVGGCIVAVGNGILKRLSEGHLGMLSEPFLTYGPATIAAGATAICYETEEKRYGIKGFATTAGVYGTLEAFGYAAADLFIR